MNIGERIKERRLELGMTLEDVGDIVGVGKSTVRKWETGMIRNMKRDKIYLLANALQISPAEFISMDTPTDQPEPLAPDEQRLVRAYRNAEPPYPSIALELLESHQRQEASLTSKTG